MFIPVLQKCLEKNELELVLTISSLVVSPTCTAGGGGGGGGGVQQSVLYTTLCPAPALAVSTIISKHFNNTYYHIII